MAITFDYDVRKGKQGEPIAPKTTTDSAAYETAKKGSQQKAAGIVIENGATEIAQSQPKGIN